MDSPGIDEGIVTACEISRLSAEVKSLKSYNSILLQQLQFLEKECAELKSQLKDMKEQYSSLQADAAKRKIYTSMMETNNRINERKLEELKQEVARLNTGIKRQAWEQENRVLKIRKEHVQELDNQETVHGTTLDHIVSQNQMVVAGLRESISGKNAIISSVLQYFMATYNMNSEALMALCQSCVEHNSLPGTPNVDEARALKGVSEVQDASLGTLND